MGGVVIYLPTRWLAMKGINIPQLYQSTKKPNQMLRDTSTTRLLFEVWSDVFGVKQNSSIFCIYIYTYHGCWRRESNSLSLTFMKLMNSVIIPLKIGHEKKDQCVDISHLWKGNHHTSARPKRIAGRPERQNILQRIQHCCYCSVSAKIQKISYDLFPPLRIVEFHGI